MGDKRVFLDTRDAMRKADQMDELADSLRRSTRRIFDGAPAEMDRAWSGEASEEFYRKRDRLQRRLDKRADQMNRAADALRHIAKLYYMKEKEATTLFGGR